MVTYNSGAVIGDCLDALARMAPGVEVIVVDNASADGTVAEIEAEARAGVRVIANKENRGFAGAVNQGVRATNAENILMLNPDTRLLTSVDGLVEAARDSGLSCGKLTDETGKAQAGFTVRRFPTAATLCFELMGLNRLWPSNPVNRKYRYLDWDLEQGAKVEQPAGAFLLFRRDVWEKLGGLDEGFYPVWFEDVDFCLRATEAGYSATYVPAVEAEHEGAHSVGKVGAGCRLRYWCASLLRYAGKHFGSIGYRGVCMAVAITSVPRTVAGMMQEHSVNPLFSGLQILSLAVGRIVSPRRSGEYPRLAS